MFRGTAEAASPALPIQSIAIEEKGLGQIHSDFVREQFGIQAGDPYDAEVILTARDELLATGHFDSVTLFVEETQHGPILHLSLSTKPILAKLRFKGLGELTRQDALRLVSLPYGERTDATALASAANRLSLGLARKGRLEAKVQWKAEPLANGNIEAWFVIQAGPVFRIGNVEIIGWPHHLPAAPRPPQSGSLFRPDEILASATRLEGAFRNAGYAFAEVAVDWKVSDHQKVDVSLHVTPGNQYRVRGIEVKGLEITDETVARSVIGTATDALYDERSIQADLDRLRNRGMFGGVEIEAVQTGPGDVDLVYHLEEKRSGTFLGGLEYGQDEGLAFVLEVKERNFSFKPPFRGDGIETDFQAVIGDERLRLHARVFQPSTRGGPGFYGAGIGAAQLEYLSEDYNQRQFNLDGLFGRNVHDHWSGALGYQISHFEIYDVAANAPLLIQEEEGTSRFAGPFAQIGYNTMAGGLRPRSGLSAMLRTEVGTDLAPGTVEAFNTRLTAQWHTSPFPGHTLSVKGRVRAVSPYGDTERAPLPLREFLGGISNLRGFEFRSVSPRNEEGDEIGGETSWFTSVEYSVPFPGLSFLDISAFVDVGNVGLDSFDLGQGDPASNIGIGLLLLADNFPLRVNVATPLTLPETDTVNERDQFRISFSAGTSF